MKIGILGIGGVGSLLASRLSKTNHKIYCLGSKKSNSYNKKNGIHIKSKYYGESKFYPKFFAQEVEKLDILFITVKGTKLLSALNDYKEFFDKKTVGILLLNGLGYKETVLQKSEIQPVIATIGSLEVFINSENHTVHLSNKRPLIEIGIPKNLKGVINQISLLLNQVQIDSNVFADENFVIWRKLVRLTTISTITSIFDTNIGTALKNKESRELILKLINELCLISSKIGYKFEPNLIFNEIKRLPYCLKTSMQKDIKKGKESELEFILKNPIDIGNKFGLDLSTCEYCYKLLIDKIDKT